MKKPFVIKKKGIVINIHLETDSKQLLHGFASAKKG